MESIRDFKLCISLHGHKSEWFTVGQGVHQDGPLSSLQFQIFFDDQINELQDCGHGVKIYDVEVDSLAFADDIDIVSLSMNGLQKMSDISYRYSRKWRFNFSAPKCIVMTFGHSLDQQPITLGGEVLMEVTCCINLGTPMYSKSKHELEEVENRIVKAYKKSLDAQKHGFNECSNEPHDFCKRLLGCCSFKTVLWHVF